jgi:hypothetical protein
VERQALVIKVVVIYSRVSLKRGGFTGFNVSSFFSFCPVAVLFSYFLDFLLTLIRMTKDEKGLAVFKGLLL